MTDPTLCAKVAEVIGKELVGVHGGACAVRLHHDDQRSNVYGNVARWTPDIPGADYCEARTWLLDNDFRIFEKLLPNGYMCLLKSRDGTKRHGIAGRTPEEAMCLAMVSEGGE